MKKTENGKKVNPLISIIIPFFNTESYITNCINSLVNQTYKDIEIIFINDGSTDNTSKIIETFVNIDKRVKLITQKNNGPASARNAGLTNASGDYIMFCDSDDYYEKNMCELMLNCIVSNNVDLCICDTIFHKLGKYNRSKVVLDAHKLKLKKKYILNDKLRAEVFVTLWNKIFKREIIDNFSINFPNGYEYDDCSFVYQYLFYSKTVYALDKKLYNYVLRSDSIIGSLNYNEKFYHWIESMSYCQKKLKTHSTQNSDNFIALIIEKDLNWILSKLNKINKKIFLDRLEDKILSHFSDNIFEKHQLLSLINKKSYNKFFYNLKKINSVVEKVKIMGISFIQVKYRKQKVAYYLLKLQILKIKTESRVKQIYVLGIMIFWYRQ